MMMIALRKPMREPLQPVCRLFKAGPTWRHRYADAKSNHHEQTFHVPAISAMTVSCPSAAGRVRQSSEQDGHWWAKGLGAFDPPALVVKHVESCWLILFVICPSPPRLAIAIERIDYDSNASRTHLHTLSLLLLLSSTSSALGRNNI